MALGTPEDGFAGPGFNPLIRHQNPKPLVINRLPGAFSLLLSQPLGAAFPAHKAPPHLPASPEASIASVTVFESPETSEQPAFATNPKPPPSRNPGPRTEPSACDASPIFDLDRRLPQSIQRLTTTQPHHARSKPKELARRQPSSPNEDTSAARPSTRQLTCNSPPRPSPPFTSCALKLRTATTSLFHASMNATTVALPSGVVEKPPKPPPTFPPKPASIAP